MNEKHYKEKLSAFVNHELSGDERQTIGEHLFECADCRREHDEIKFGAELAGELKRADATANLYRKIESALDEKNKKSFAAARFNFFNAPILAAVGLLIICASVAVIYFARARNEATATIKNENQNALIESPQIAVSTNETISNQTANQPDQISATDAPNANSQTLNQSRIAAANVENPPQILANKSNEIKQTETNLTAWNVETLAGTPRVGDALAGEILRIGELLETDANSRARIKVANIGSVEIAPNSIVKLVDTKATEHRLALEKGALKAKIIAPPRLFIVDTPSAVAVDLGCEYTLEVDEKGDGKLRVTSGFVALENGKTKSIVPAGAVALTKRDKGIGTPFAEDSTKNFQAALYAFDFENGGAQSLETIVNESSLYDSLTLWHLLVRVEKSERGKIFDALAARVKPPPKVTREGVLRLDKKMLDAWREEVEIVWFG